MTFLHFLNHLFVGNFWLRPKKLIQAKKVSLYTIGTFIHSYTGNHTILIHRWGSSSFLSAAGSVEWNLHGVTSRDSNAGLSNSKTAHYRLFYAAPYDLRRTLTELSRTLLSYAAPYLSYAAPYLSYAAPYPSYAAT